MEMNIEEWGTVYNNPHVRIKASPDKTKLFIEIKQQAGLDDHSTMVKNIADALIKAGIKSFNVDHIRWQGKQKTLQLDYGKVRADFNIYYKGEEIVLEVKPETTVLMDSTREQLEVLVRLAKNVGLFVEEKMIEKADLMLKINALYPRVKLVCYEKLLKDPHGELEKLL